MTKDEWNYIKAISSQESSSTAGNSNHETVSLCGFEVQCQHALDALRKRMALVLGLPLGDPEGGAVLQHLVWKTRCGDPLLAFIEEVNCREG